MMIESRKKLTIVFSVISCQLDQDSISKMSPVGMKNHLFSLNRMKFFIMEIHRNTD